MMFARRRTLLRTLVFVSKQGQLQCTLHTKANKYFWSLKPSDQIIFNFQELEKKTLKSEMLTLNVLSLTDIFVVSVQIRSYRQNEIKNQKI